MKVIRSLSYHWRTTTHNLTRNISNAVSSIFAVMITSIFIMLFTVLAINISGFTVNVEDNIQIFARVDALVDEKDYTDLQKEIEKVDHVKSVRFSSASEQLEALMADQKNSDHYEALKKNNPLPAAFYIDVDKGENVESVNDIIAELSEIMDTNYGGDAVSQMVNGFSSLRLYGGIFIVILSLLAIFLVSNTIKITIYNRRDEIAIMRQVGASNRFIKIPFLMEGCVLGILGSIIPILIAVFGYNYLYGTMNGVFLSPMFKLQPAMPFLLYESLILLAVGILVGLFGSLFAINKYLKLKR